MKPAAKTDAAIARLSTSLRIVSGAAIILYGIFVAHVPISWRASAGWLALAVIAACVVAVLANLHLVFGAKESIAPMKLARELTFFCSVAVFEELFFRGVALPLVAQQSTFMIAAIVVTIGFAIGHFSQGYRGILVHIGTGTLFLLALVLSGSLLTAIVAHVTYNAVTVALRYIPRSLSHDPQFRAWSS